MPITPNKEFKNYLKKKRREFLVTALIIIPWILYLLVAVFTFFGAFVDYSHHEKCDKEFNKRIEYVFPYYISGCYMAEYLLEDLRKE